MVKKINSFNVIMQIWKKNHNFVHISFKWQDFLLYFASQYWNYFKFEAITCNFGFMTKLTWLRFSQD